MITHTLKRMFVCLSCACLMGMIPGCKDLQETDDLNIVLGIGIDELSDNQVQVSVQIVDPLGGESGGQSSNGKISRHGQFVREETGKTVEEAIDRFGQNVARRLFLAHNTVVVFGQNYAQHGINNALDYLERNRSYRRNELFVVTDVTAAQLLQASGRPEPYSAVAIRSLVEQGVKRAAAVNSTQLSVMREYLRPSHSPNLAYVTMSNSNIGPCGIGLFNGGQFKGHLTSSDAQALSFFLGGTNQVEITMPCAAMEVPQTDVSDTFRMLHTDTNITPMIQGKHIQFRVTVRGTAEIERLCPGSRITPESYKKFEARLNSDVKDRMQRVLTQLQTENVDSVQFASTMFAKNPIAWRRISKQWETVFPDIQVTYNVQIQLLRHGLVSKSPDTEYSPQGLPPRAGRVGTAF